MSSLNAARGWVCDAEPEQLAAEIKRELALERAFKRRFPFPKPKVLCVSYSGNVARVSDPETRAWIDFDTSWWRIRAVAWNGPEPVQ